eukprot:614645-Pelagomonas_calceolata.AAC.7
MHTHIRTHLHKLQTQTAKAGPSTAATAPSVTMSKTAAAAGAGKAPSQASSSRALAAAAAEPNCTPQQAQQQQQQQVQQNSQPQRQQEYSLLQQAQQQQQQHAQAASTTAPTPRQVSGSGMGSQVLFQVAPGIVRQVPGLMQCVASCALTPASLLRCDCAHTKASVGIRNGITMLLQGYAHTYRQVSDLRPKREQGTVRTGVWTLLFAATSNTRAKAFQMQQGLLLLQTALCTCPRAGSVMHVRKGWSSDPEGKGWFSDARAQGLVQ